MSLMAGESSFFSINDNTASCGWNSDDESKLEPLTRAYVEKVEFGLGRPPVVSVTAQTGTRKMTPAEVRACLDEYNPSIPHRGLDFSPPTKRYRVDFFFDGQGYKPH